MSRPRILALAACLAAAGFQPPAHADEGMWTYDNFPAARVRERHGATLDGAWLERVRQASVRLSNCSASFVSRDGLILTNHHCIEACLAENSTKERSLIETGMLARSREQELRCGAQVADVLQEMQDVTAQVAAATRGLDDKAANEARKRRLTELESACEKAAPTGKVARRQKCETVTLYSGGQYFLYKYRRYSDVRLVFAPEAAIAAFGGDPDNFQFPRWCLDMGLLRAYEDGKPVRVERPLRIDFAGPAAGELVLVSGHPGGTDRLLTVAQLALLRDTVLPPTLLRSSELRGRYIQFAQRGDAERRITQEPLNNLENGLKVRRKLLDALLDEQLMARKRREEAELRQRAAALPALAGLGDPWADIEAATRTARALDLPYTFLENGAGFNSRLFRYARTLVRAADERQRPDGERLREFTETSLPRLEQQLAAPVPVYPEIEELTLTFGFERMREWLGPDHPVVRRVLGAESPATLARRLVGGSRLADPAVRLSLWKGGKAALEASDDPMVRLARDVDAESRAVRKRLEDEVEAPTRVATEKIARARFAVYGTGVYPDATFTLRLSYGTVRGWDENGVAIEPFTRLGRAFERATGQEPFRIPASWLAVRERLDLQTPFNVATDNDIIGGNSGSPLVNARGDVVGLIFDGNIHSIAGDYGFDAARNRAIAVHPAIMREALAKVYDARELLEELQAR
ncbi:MAG: S46 family peptidase [Steroidobacteraceae bacterium]|jgi:hypothetical protein|nr:S46 family peptidase [Steroidobacteraceae bacterium]